MAEQNTSSTDTSRTRTTSTGASHAQARSMRGQESGRAAEHSPQSGNTRLVDRVKESASQQLATQKDRGVDAIGSVAQAVRSTTQKLRDDRHDALAGYLDKAAEQIETWSQRLREKDVDELIGDLQRLARRQPAVFIGSAFAIGLVGARFLRSSGQQANYSYRSESRRAQFGGGYGRSHA